MWENTMYPGNENRHDRVIQLYADCESLITEIANDKAAIDTLLVNANEVVANAYKNKALIPTGDYTLASTDYDVAAPIIFGIMVPVLAIPTVKNAMICTSGWALAKLDPVAFNKAVAFIREMEPVSVLPKGDVLASSTEATRLLEKEAIPNASKLANTITYTKLPGWYKVGVWVGSAAFLVAIAVAVEAVVDSIEGAVHRATFRRMTRELIDPRISLKLNAMINHRIKMTLSSVIDAFNAAKNIPGVTDEQLTVIAKNLVDNSKDSLKNITKDDASLVLYKYDLDRGAWIDEDHLAS
jgi:hypothetical protein